MTAAEFAEEVLNIELLPHQKEFINEAYQAAKDHKRMIYYPGRGQSRLILTYLQALAFIMAGQDEGVVKKEIIREQKKTCGKCKHDHEYTDAPYSKCFFCKRNPDDNREDNWEEISND